MKNHRLKYRKLENTAIIIHGGLARAFGAIGFIRFLDEQQLRPELIVGSSAGAQLAGMYALGVSWQTMLDETANFRMQQISSLSSLITRKQLFTEDGINNLFSKYIDNNHSYFDELGQKLAFIATDIKSRRGMLINQGELVTAALASNAFPWVIGQRTVFSRQLIDGDFALANVLAELKNINYDTLFAVAAIGKRPNGFMNRLVNYFWDKLASQQLSPAVAANFQLTYDASMVGHIEFWKIPDLSNRVYIHCLKNESTILQALLRRSNPELGNQ